jgi:hypothetical protein
MDDLRDYRFYAPDMMHPNEVSETYVWEKFMDRYFDDQTVAFIKEWSKLSRAIEHRPFHPESPSHQDFLKKTLEKLLVLNHRVDVSKEIEWVKGRMVKS